MLDRTEQRNCAQRLLLPERTSLGDKYVCLCVCLSPDFVISPRRKSRVHTCFSRMGLCPEKRPHYFSGPKSYPQLMSFCTVFRTKGVRKRDHLFGHFFALLLLQNLSFFTPHVISRKLISNYTSASARHRLPVVV